MLGCYRNEKLVGGCGLLEVRRFGVSKAATPPLTPYSGFMYLRDGSLKGVRVEAESERICGSLIEKLELDYDYIQISHAPDIVDIRYFQWSGWRTSLRYTYLIDIGELEALWESFEGRTREAFELLKKYLQDLQERVTLFAPDKVRTTEAKAYMESLARWLGSGDL